MKAALVIIGAFVGFFAFVGWWFGQLAAAAIGIGLLWVPRARALGVGLLAGVAAFWAAITILVWNLGQVGD